MAFQHLYKQNNTKKSIFYAWFEAMHTRVDIALCDLSENNSITLTERIESEICRVQEFSNRFSPHSEVSFINRSAANNPVKISPELSDIIKHGIMAYKKTLGLFDITIQSKNNYQNGIDDIILNTKENTILFKNKNVQIDLCGYIKGYALDKVKSLLENKCSNALISLGNSSVLGLGNHPNGIGWRVDLPAKENQMITLVNEYLTTSGNTNGYLHIIDPVSRDYSNSGIISVVTQSGIAGEVLSTALNLANPEQRSFIYKEFGNEISDFIFS